MSKPVSAFKAAKLLGVSGTTVLRWLEEEKFPNAIIYPGSVRDTYRIPLTDIENLKNKHYKEGA